jgi:hypothetical protein
MFISFLRPAVLDDLGDRGEAKLVRREKLRREAA